jgi:arginase family enzyme
MLRYRPDAKIVWFDAHGDFNTPETTPTGYLGGMVLSALCGLWESGLTLASHPIVSFWPARVTSTPAKAG